MPIDAKALTEAGISAALQKLYSASGESMRCFPSAYAFRIDVPANGSDTATVQIDSKGDFVAEYMVGKLFSANGDLTSGITFNLNDGGNSRDLFLNPVAAEAVLTPGYGTTIFEKWNLRNYVLRSNSQIKLSASNSSIVQIQTIELALIGRQYIGKAR